MAERNRGQTTISPRGNRGRISASILSLLRSGQTQQAWQQLQDALRHHPRSPALHRLHGFLLEHAGQLPAALNAYRQALHLAPGDGPSHAALGAFLFRQAELPAAFSHYRAALQANDRGQTTISPENRGLSPVSVSPSEQHLWPLLAALAAAGIQAFPGSGTLLGLVRDGTLIPGDKDIDFHLPFAQLPRAAEYLHSNGWQRIPLLRGQINAQSWRSPAGLTLDLNALLPQADGSLLGGYWLQHPAHPWNRLLDYPSLELIRRNGPHGPYWWPREPERLLRARYGPDWMTPDPHFDSVVAAHNLRGFSLLTACHAVSRLYEHQLHGRHERARALRLAVTGRIW